MTDKPQQEEEEKFSEKEKRRWAELEEEERTGLQPNKGHVEGELALADESSLKESNADKADVNSNRQSKSMSKPPYASDSFPQDINNKIAKLKIVIDHIDSPRNYARDLIHELARDFDERELCERARISSYSPIRQSWPRTWAS